MLDECPHCYRQVLLREDGTCPACGKQSADTTGVDPTRTLLTLKPSARLPTLCFNCANPATHHVLAQATNVDPHRGLKRIGLFFTLARVVPFLGFFLLLSRTRDVRKDITVSVRLPICKDCQKQRMVPKVESYDLHDREIRLVVHREFASAVAGLTKSG